MTKIINPHVVFTYGTLMPGYRANNMLANSDHIGKGNTKVMFYMRSASFPGVFISKACGGY